MDEENNEESNNLNSDRIDLEEVAGYGTINQIDSEISNQDNPSRRIINTKDNDSLNPNVSQQQGKAKILIKLCILGSIALLIFGVFMIFFTDKKVEVKTIFRQDQGECPQQQQFSPVSSNCVKCPQSCINCIPGIGKSNPCVQCLVSFSLFGEDCVKTCPKGYQSLEGICLQDKKKSFTMGRLKINNTNQSVIDYIIYLPHNLAKKVVFLIPPVGSNQLYYSSKTDLSQFADSTDAAIITFSTPVHLVAEMVPHDSQNRAAQYFPFVKILAEQLLQLVDRSDVTQYFYVGISDSIILCLQLNNYVIQNNICQNCYQYIVTLQTQQTTLSLTFKVDQKELLDVLEYINGQYPSKNSSSIQGDLKANQIIDIAKFNLQFSQEVVKQSADYTNNEIIMLNELSTNSNGQTFIDISWQRANPIIMVNSLMTELSQEQQKIEYLISNLLHDLISQYGSWLVRQDIYDEL